MADTEKGFIRELTGFLRKDLGVRVPITASQITYHGAEIVAETCDYADIHAYWQHPQFPGRPWDPVNWTIRNTPMEQAPDADSLLSRAPWRLLDRPFTLSEWNIPDPNDYAASMVPFAAMVAALQDWDGVFFFEYHSSQEGWDTDRMRGYFSFNGQPVKLALLAACANLYRRGDSSPCRSRGWHAARHAARHTRPEPAHRHRSQSKHPSEGLCVPRQAARKPRRPGGVGCQRAGQSARAGSTLRLRARSGVWSPGRSLTWVASARRRGDGAQLRRARS